MDGKTHKNKSSQTFPFPSSLETTQKPETLSDSKAIVCLYDYDFMHHDYVVRSVLLLTYLRLTACYKILEEQTPAPPLI